MSAGYDDIFVPPFEPWATSAVNGSAVSEPGVVLGEAAGVNDGNGGGGGTSGVDGETATSAGGSWVPPPEISLKNNDDCMLTLTPFGG